MRHDKNCGFTLIELSIVLVIIGLITGSILLGRDLIRAAEIRATVSQLEKYSTAVNTFKGKYGSVPGDLAYTQAGGFGFFAFSDASRGQRGEGDANGFIENSSGPSSWVVGTYILPVPGDPFKAGGEQYVFWRHLSDALLIDGSYAATLDSGGNSTVATSKVEQYFPPAKIGRGVSTVVFSDKRYNYLGIGTVTGIAAGFTNWITVAMGEPAGITPTDARAIDVKVDDGMPNNGRARAMGTDWTDETPNAGIGHFAMWNNTPGAGNCVQGGADPLDTRAQYDVSSAAANINACDMAFRFQ